MDDLNFVKKILGGTYTIVQAALLINGEDPLSTVRIDQIEEGRKRQLFLMTISALKNDIISSKLPADMFFDKKSKRMGGYLGLMEGEGIDLLSPRSNNITSATYKDIDENHTTIKEADLLKWLEHRDIRPPFFFSPVKKQEAIPGYMNPEMKCYSAKLHAAICAWEAVSTDPGKIDKDGEAINGKSVKQNIEDWLLENIERFPILKKNDGEAKETVIKNEIGKIVNWDGDGGANKTLSRKWSGGNLKNLKNR